MTLSKTQPYEVSSKEIALLVHQDMSIEERECLEEMLKDYNRKHPEYTIYFDVSQNNDTIYSKRLTI